MSILGSLASLIVLLLSFSQVYSQVCTGTTPLFVPDRNICVMECPIGYYVSTSGAQQVCLTQIPMKAVVHPTVEERVFILSFSQAPIPYSTEEDLEANVRLTMSSPTQPDTIVPVTAIFLSETDPIVQLTLPDNQTIPIQATFRLELFNLRTSQDSQTTVIGPVVFSSLSANQRTEHDDNVVAALTRLDRGLEYTWIAITTLNPYAFLYMNTKFYRETLEMFKRLNVQHGAIAARFLRSNNNKFSGFKAPNMFPILLMEDEVTSGWNRYKENDMILENRDPDRVPDFEITVTDTVHYYDATPLFLDNYGIQITVFFAVIVLIIIFEILNYVFRPKGSLVNSKARKLLQAIRIYLRWNLLIASIMGSYQSLIYYIIVQIQALSSKVHSIEHNTLNFWFAIASFIILALGFPTFLLYKIISIEKKRRTNNPAFETEKEYYGIIFMFNNLDDFKSLTFIFALQIKAVILAVLTLLLHDHPVAQVATVLSITIAFAIYIAILRPFSRLIYNIYQLGNELVLVAFLATLLYNAHQNEDGILNDNEANASGYVVIAFWMLLPTLGIIFGIAGFIMRLSGISTQKPLKPFVPVITASGQRQEEMALKKPIESQENVEGNAKLAVQSQTENYVRASIAQGVGLENSGPINLETVSSGQYAKETSFHKSIMSLPQLDIVDEEAEREQGSAETPVQHNKTVPNFYKTNSQIMTPIRASSFDKGNGLNESKETIPEFRGILALPKLPQSRDSSVMLEIPDFNLSRRSQRPATSNSNSVSFDRQSMERRKSVEFEKRFGNAVFRHEPEDNNRQQNARPNLSYNLSPSRTVLGARATNRSYMSSMQTNRARFYEDDEGFKKFKERFTFDEI